MAKKKIDRKNKNISETRSIRSIISNETTDAMFGLILIAIAIVMIIAMSSFFATGAADQSILENMRTGEWLNSDKQFTNYCGSLGALMAYYLMSVNFGLPAFLIPVFIILVGLKLLRAYNVNLWKWFFGMALVMIWSSVTFAKILTPIMSGLTFNPGGNHGLYCVQQLENLIGPPGLTAILFLVATAFLAYLSAETIEVIRKALNPVEYLSSKIKFSVTNTLHKDEEEDVEPIYAESTGDNTDTYDSIDNSNNGNEAQTVDLTVTEGVQAQTITVEQPDGQDEENDQEQDEDCDLTVTAAPAVEQGQGRDLTIEEIMKTPINPLEPFVNYKKPGLDLLKKYDDNKRPVVDMEEITANKNRIVEVLDSFGVKISRISATVGPTITLYEITPAEGVRINKIRNLEDDIALNLAAQPLLFALARPR